MPSDPRDKQFETSHLKENLGARTGKGSILAILFAILKFILKLGSTAILARLVIPADHGLIAMAIPLILIATGLSEFGLSQALVQVETVSHRQASAMFWVNIGLGLFFAGLLMALAPTVGGFYGEERVGAVLIALAPAVLMAAAVVQYISLLRRQMLIGKAERATFAAMAGSLIIAVSMALAGFGYWALVAQVVAQPGLLFLILVLMTKWVPSPPSLRALVEARGLLGFGGYLTLARLLMDVMNNLPSIIIGRVFGAAPAGMYYRSRTLAQLPPDLVVSSLSSSFLPSMSRAQKDPSLFRSIFTRAITRMALIVMPVAVGICATADLIVSIVLGPNWTAAGPILAWLGLLIVDQMMMAPLNWALIAHGKGPVIFRLKIYAAGVITAALLMGMNLSMNGMIIMFVLAQILLISPVVMWHAVRHTPLEWGIVMRAILPDLLLFAAALSATLALRSALPGLSAPAEILLAGLLIGAIYLGWMLLNPGLRADVAKALRLILAGVARRRHG